MTKEFVLTCKVCEKKITANDTAKEVKGYVVCHPCCYEIDEAFYWDGAYLNEKYELDDYMQRNKNV